MSVGLCVYLISGLNVLVWIVIRFEFDWDVSCAWLPLGGFGYCFAFEGCLSFRFMFVVSLLRVCSHFNCLFLVWCCVWFGLRFAICSFRLVAVLVVKFLDCFVDELLCLLAGYLYAAGFHLDWIWMIVILHICFNCGWWVFCWWACWDVTVWY